MLKQLMKCIQNCWKRRVQIMDDPSHPLYSYFKYLPSGIRLQLILCKTNDYLNSFVSSAVRGMSTELFWCGYVYLMLTVTVISRKLCQNEFYYGNNEVFSICMYLCLALFKNISLQFSLKGGRSCVPGCPITNALLTIMRRWIDILYHNLWYI